ncbi:hypothetical protein PSA7680_02273 [Pseudoruegeria aquimaris]|uniref:Lipoprotein n=1 Tax=Pseudoruegeria aquimaris TaxID=393663 RepID=A0A1Y5STL8_9RHOB|nr:hypothetical protein [Pseudoruegeria aquimaris]SLN44793.1 hypothetical protein PSA7680_02273 [Pseudoruegeria aquimaris]
MAGVFLNLGRGAICGAALVAAVALLSACSNAPKQTYDGVAFKTKLSSERKARREFAVRVSPAAASVEGAKEAARHEAVRHCIKYYGSSDIDWRVGPDTPLGQLSIIEGAITFAGSCTG